MATWRLPALGRVTSPYGPRELAGAIGDFHYGTDLGAKRGPVYAAQAGVVRTIWKTARGAWVVDLRHPDEGGQQIRTRYVHMYLDEITVKTGQHVSAGQRIGNSGASGTTAAHLHFEFLVNGAYTDPEIQMRARGVRLGQTVTVVDDDTDTPGTPDLEIPDLDLPDDLEAQMTQTVLDRIATVRSGQLAHDAKLDTLLDYARKAHIARAAHTQTLAVIKAAVTGSAAPVVDEAAIAHGIAVELAPAVTAAVLDALPAPAGLTPEEHRALAEQAIRTVLGSLDEPQPAHASPVG